MPLIKCCSFTKMWKGPQRPAKANFFIQMPSFHAAITPCRPFVSICLLLNSQNSALGFLVKTVRFLLTTIASPLALALSSAYPRLLSSRRCSIVAWLKFANFLKQVSRTRLQSTIRLGIVCTTWNISIGSLTALISCSPSLKIVSAILNKVFDPS